MDLPAPALAFILPSGPEMIVILFLGIMLFGRRLPEVGRTVGTYIFKMRQGLHKLKSEMDIDGDVQEMRDAFRDTRDHLTKATAVPRALKDPGRMLKDLTDEALSSAPPSENASGDAAAESAPAREVPASLFESDTAPGLRKS